MHPAGAQPGGDALVSVVVPCHDSREFVRETIETVFAQTHRPLELICVDDGSTDGTADLLDEIALHSPISMRVLRTTNAGASAARNTGLRLATGGYTQFLDSDDLLHETKIAHQLALAAAAPVPPDVVAGDYVQHGPAGRRIVRRVDRRGAYYGLVGSNLGLTSSNLWRTGELRRVGGFDDALATCEEYDLIFRLLGAGGELVADPVPLTEIRWRPGSLSRSRRREHCIRSVRLRADRLAGAEERGASSPALRQLAHDMNFLKLRELAVHDRPEAERLYAEMLPSGFVPSDPAVSRRYRILIRLLGFGRAHRVWSVLRRG
jgi:glycosyltransferase involved in cell wall biosynthesis